jgi:hypothetical protein
MINRTLVRKSVILAFAMSYIVVPHLAKAGFEWNPPAPPTAAMPLPPSILDDVRSAKKAPALGKPESITPTVQVFDQPVDRPSVTVIAPNTNPVVVIEGTRGLSIDQTVSLDTGNAPRVEPLALAPLTPESPMQGVIMPVAPVTDMVPVPPTVQTSDVVRGFANHVPLSVALRQLLPVGYGFSVDPAVDLGTQVSFRGGKLWRDTLADALTPVGLAAREQGQMVTVVHVAVNAEPVIEDLPLTPVVPSVSLSPQPHVLALPAAPVAVPQAPILLPPSLPIQTNGVSSDERPPLLETWNAERGDSLRLVLDRWARRAGVEFNWMSEYDYPLQASVHLTGTFEDAARNLLLGFEAAHPQPVAELHSNSRVGQTVLIVTSRGNVGQ